MESIVGQDQKETEEVPQSGRGADGNARKKPNSDEHGAEYFRYFLKVLLGLIN